VARNALRIVTLAIGSLTLPSQAAAEQRAVLAFVGPLNSVSVGQDGYCGDRTYADADTKAGFYVAGGRKTWIGVRSTFYAAIGGTSCEAELSFVPAPGKTYILRLTRVADGCSIGLYRAVPGGTPVREPVEREPPRSCLLEKARSSEGSQPP